jgi:NAD(P)-dependent dehydrogenase (short-subunit alcohol dehydrogenase family)
MLVHKRGVMEDVHFGFTAGNSIVITGAGSGIGRATALQAARQGLEVGVWDMNPAGVTHTVNDIVALGGTAHGEVGDVSDVAGVHAAMERTARALGPIHYLHNNAGPPSTAQLDFRDAVQLCIGSVHTVTEAWLPHAPKDGAAMVVTSSVAGNLIGTNNAWYSAAKAGLMGYVRHLAAHRAHEFRSNGVAPGMTNTPRLEGFAKSEMGERIMERIPLHRIGEADDIAFATLFLLSPTASYINGVFLPVDGGWTVTQ